MEKIFIRFPGESVEVISGVNAEKLLQEKNDLKYFSEGVGIKEVDKNRWLEAQEYERRTWCVGPGKYCMDDRNITHRNNFNNYKDLPSLLKNDLSIIELGCGPFTNLRIILPLLRKSVQSIDLLDPLIMDYILTSPNCSYKSGMIDFHNVNLIKSSIEDFNFSSKYDLVIMINVLEHCFNIDLVFEKIFNMMNENAIFLFADKVFKEDYILKSLHNYYDPGHPIVLSEKYFNEKIKNFEILYSKEIDMHEERDYVDKYLILRKI